ncbi:MAG: lipopolysaccharide biosynthesis protein [Alphaproteobacteria bacterium]|nr:lipopolysaccharide biosynthesis protein [Alphaproteobacteria bacterium]
MRVLAGRTPSPAFKRLWDGDTFSSLVIMGMRIGMLAAKFILSLFIARYMGLEELGVYGLIVGASGTVQAVMRGGVFTSLSREAVGQPQAELADNLRHYGLGIIALYTLLIPLALLAGAWFDAQHIALLALAVFVTEHLSYDSFILINNLQYPKIANLIFSAQSAIWIYLFVAAAFFAPELRSLEAILAFWIGGGLFALAIAGGLSHKWPWRAAFRRRIDFDWYPKNIRRSFRLYIVDVLSVFSYYIDRYIVTAFLSLELTGIYIFFGQIVTAIWNLVNSGVMIVYRPRLIQQYDNRDMKHFNTTFKACLVRTVLTTVALCLLAAAAMPFIVTLADREQLLAHLPFLWALLSVLPLRAAATAGGNALYTMHKDRENIIYSIIGFALSLVVGVIGVALFGLYGIVLSTVAVAFASIVYTRSVWPRRSHV